VQLGSIVMDSAIIGSYAIVTAGSVVPPEFRIPAKQVGIISGSC